MGRRRPAFATMQEILTTPSCCWLSRRKGRRENDLRADDNRNISKEGSMGLIEWLEGFIGLFKAAESFTGLVTGICRADRAVDRDVCDHHVDRRGAGHPRGAVGGYAVTRYTIMPIIAGDHAHQPDVLLVRRFLPERQKPAFYDAAVLFVHPVLPFFRTPTRGAFLSGKIAGAQR